MKNRNTFAKSFSTLTVITLIEKLIAFIFEAVIAAVYGTSIYTDAYFSTAELFIMTDSALFNSLTVVVLNRFSVHMSQDDNDKAFRSLSNILSIYLPITAVISILAFVFATPISYVAAPGFDEPSRAVMVRCIRIMSVVPMIVCITSIGLAVLRRNKRFGITELKSLFISVIGIISVLVFGSAKAGNADALSIAYVVSVTLYCILIFITLSKYGNIRPVKPVFDDEIKITFKMVFPLMFSYGIASASLMIDKIISSLLGDGQVSALTYSHTLYRVVESIFISNLGIILLTDFNELMANKTYDAAINKIKKVVTAMILLLIPITVTSIICSKEIVKIVYERGRFTDETTVQVAGVLVFYALNFVPAMIHALFNQVFYSAGDTKTPMRTALICVIVNFGISLPLVYLIGLPGVAIGTVVSTVAAAIICRIKVRKHLPRYKGAFGIRFVLSCLCALAVSTTLSLLTHMIRVPALFSFLFVATVSFISFWLVMFAVRDSVFIGLMGDIREIIKSRFSSKSKNV